MSKHSFFITQDFYKLMCIYSYYMSTYIFYDQYPHRTVLIYSCYMTKFKSFITKVLTLITTLVLNLDFNSNLHNFRKSMKIESSNLGLYIPTKFTSIISFSRHFQQQHNLVFYLTTIVLAFAQPLLKVESQMSQTISSSFISFCSTIVVLPCSESKLQEQ